MIEPSKPQLSPKTTRVSATRKDLKSSVIGKRKQINAQTETQGNIDAQAETQIIQLSEPEYDQYRIQARLTGDFQFSPRTQAFLADRKLETLQETLQKPRKIDETELRTNRINTKEDLLSLLSLDALPACPIIELPTELTELLAKTASTNKLSSTESAYLDQLINISFANTELRVADEENDYLRKTKSCLALTKLAKELGKSSALLIAETFSKDDLVNLIDEIHELRIQILADKDEHQLVDMQVELESITKLKGLSEAELRGLARHGAIAQSHTSDAINETGITHAGTAIYTNLAETKASIAGEDIEDLVTALINLANLAAIGMGRSPASYIAQKYKINQLEELLDQFDDGSGDFDELRTISKDGLEELTPSLHCVNDGQFWTHLVERTTQLGEDETGHEIPYQDLNQVIKDILIGLFKSMHESGELESFLEENHRLHTQADIANTARRADDEVQALKKETHDEVQALKEHQARADRRSSMLMRTGAGALLLSILASLSGIRDTETQPNETVINDKPIIEQAKPTELSDEQKQVLTASIENTLRKNFNTKFKGNFKFAFKTNFEEDDRLRRFAALPLVITYLHGQKSFNVIVNESKILELNPKDKLGLFAAMNLLKPAIEKYGFAGTPILGDFSGLPQDSENSTNKVQKKTNWNKEQISKTSNELFQSITKIL